MLRSFLLQPIAPSLVKKFPLISLDSLYIPSRPFTVLVWPAVGAMTLLVCLVFWWIVHRHRETT